MAITIICLELVILGLLLWLVCLDFQTGLLPDKITLPAACIVLVLEALQGRFESAIIGMFFGFALLKITQLFYQWLKGFDGLGSGDVKLMLTLGTLTSAWVGWGVVAVIGLGCALAILFNLPRIFQLQSNAKIVIPFAPYLILAALIIKVGIVTYHEELLK